MMMIRSIVYTRNQLRLVCRVSRINGISNISILAAGCNSITATNANDKYCRSRGSINTATLMQRRGLMDFSYVIQNVQSAVNGLHTMTGLPWWATFICSTAIVKVGLFPLVRLQLFTSKKLGNAIPEINFLYQLVRQRLEGTPVRNTTERIRIMSIFAKGVKSCLIVHEISPLAFFAYPFINFALFLTFVWSIRDMIANSGDVSLEDGGLLWFADLTAKDSTFLLPLGAIGLSYASIHIAFTGINAGRMSLLFMDFFQSIILLSAPFVTPLPAGIFCYWIPSTLFGIAQIYTLRNPYMTKLLRLPPPRVKT